MTQNSRTHVFQFLTPSVEKIIIFTGSSNSEVSHPHCAFKLNNSTQNDDEISTSPHGLSILYKLF